MIQFYSLLCLIVWGTTLGLYAQTDTQDEISKLINVEWKPDFKNETIRVQITNLGDQPLLVDTSLNFGIVPLADSDNVTTAEKEFFQQYQAATSKACLIEVVFFPNDNPLTEHKLYGGGRMRGLSEVKSKMKVEIESRIKGGYEEELRHSRSILAFLVYKGKIFDVVRFSRDSLDAAWNHVVLDAK
jgi:hypothetical protein